MQAQDTCPHCSKQKIWGLCPDQDLTLHGWAAVRETIDAILGLTGGLIMLGGFLWLLIMAQTLMWPWR